MAEKFLAHDHVTKKSKIFQVFMALKSWTPTAGVLKNAERDAWFTFEMEESKV